MFPVTVAISVIIPVYNGGDDFRRCLQSVAAALGPADELIVVADGDTDGSRLLAEAVAGKVLKLSAPGGPARARNRGAAAASGDILFFADADVTLPPDALERLRKVFLADPGIAAVIGSYDDAPDCPNFLSQYKNLLHHYVHQTSNEEASTFWGACGAVRREIFSAAGGFDEGYKRPCIEDIELGYRLKERGFRIRLVKDIRIKHLKCWTARSLLMADFFDRALPWTDLILRRRGLINDLNIKVSSRLCVILTYLLLFGLMGAIFLPALIVVSAFSATALFVLNYDLYRFFMKKRGVWFATKTIPWHWFYFLYSGLAFAIGLWRYRTSRTARICGSKNTAAT